MEFPILRVLGGVDAHSGSEVFALRIGSAYYKEDLVWKGVRTDHAAGSFGSKGSVVPVLELLAGRMEQRM